MLLLAGGWITPEIVHGTEEAISGQPPEQFVQLRFEQGLRNGVIHVEVMRGGMVSAPKVLSLWSHAGAGLVPSCLLCPPGPGTWRLPTRVLLCCWQV